MEEEEEEDSFQEDEDEVDEDMEAMLYSQIHYELDDTMGQEMAATQNQLYPEYQHIFTVTPLKMEHSSVSLTDSVRCAAASAKQQPLFESVSFDHEDLSAEHEESWGNIKSAVADTHNDSAIQADCSVLSQAADVVYVDSSKAAEKVSDDKHQVKFDIETELGISVSPKTKKGNKTENDKDASVHALKSSEPKISERPATFSTPEFIKIDKHASPNEKDYRKTLNRLLTSHSKSRKVKEEVVIKADSASTSSSSSSDLGANESSDKDSSSVSNSESDVEVLGSTPADKSAEEPTLDLSWNISAADRQTIDRIEKGASQVNESKWKIDDTDLMLVTRPQVSRYYAKKQIRCRNCDKEGHISKVCPEPKKKPACGLCGIHGHFMNRCPKRLCFNCNQPGHKGHECPLPRRNCFAKCFRCHFKGHDENHCPDLWRQYHLTVTASEDLDWSWREVNPRRYCCNCAKQGHFAHECRQERMNKFYFPPSPFVITYNVASIKPNKVPYGLRSTVRGNEDTGKAKKFKSNHRHSSTPQQSQGNQMYPRGHPGSVSKPHNQRYFNAQSSTPSTPHHHTPSSGSYINRSQEKDGQKVHTTSQPPDQHGGTPGRRYLSPYTKTFVRSIMHDEDSRNTDHRSEQWGGDNHFDGQDKSNPRKRQRFRNRIRSSSQTQDRGNGDSPPPSKRRRDQRRDHKQWVKSHTSHQDTQAQTKVRKKKKAGKKKQGKVRGEMSHQHHTSPSPHSDQHKTKKRRKQRGKKKPKDSVSQPSTSAKGMESLTITCKNGFRTTVKTMNFNRDSRNALH